MAGQQLCANWLALRQRSRHHQAPCRISDASGGHHDGCQRATGWLDQRRALQWRILRTAVTRERIIEAISVWFGEPQGLAAQAPQQPRSELESAVARGAAYYGLVRRGTACASEPAARVLTTSGGAPTTVCKASVFCLPGSKRAPLFHF